MAELPKFSSDTEAAEFWEQHALSDFKAELEPAAVEFSRGHDETVPLAARNPRSLKTPNF